MRVTVGAIAVLGMAVTVAVAQPPVRERAAAFRPPQAPLPGELPPVARGAIDDFPASSLPTTPVSRPGGRGPGVASGPAWLTGADPNVFPASGANLKGTNVRPLTPPTGVLKDEPPTPRFIDRVKAPFIGEKSAPPQPLPPMGTKSQPQPVEQPTAASAYRSTGVNGAPVFAGPPAYRWYGWGSVTPGANPLAPSGQYPKASANWFAITGATPGAFPVPVSNAGVVYPGTEPPSYGLARSATTPQPVVPIAGQPQPGFQHTERSDPSKFAPVPDSKFTPSGTGSALPPSPPSFSPVPPPPAPSVPTITPPPLPRPTAVTPPTPGPPAAVAVKPSVPVVPPASTLPKPDQGAMLPPLPPLPPLPSMPSGPTVGSAKVPVPVVEATAPGGTPGPLPTSVTTTPPKEDLNWQPASESPAAPPGTWAPSPGNAPPAGGPTSRAPGAPIVARGQMNDKTPDPVATLVQQMCQGRAVGVEVRYTGTKKIQVCFEVRGATEAQKLVNDISKRPELTAYQVDFCVLVK